MRTKEIILSYLGTDIARRLNGMTSDRFEHLTAIRIRVGKPMLVYERGQEYALTKTGQPKRYTPLQSESTGTGYWPSQSDMHSNMHSNTSTETPPDLDFFIPTHADLTETIEKMSRYSMYAFEEELRMGYITLPGGHRVGLTGQAVLDKQQIRTLRHMSGLNIRIAHQIKGCADKVLPLLMSGERGNPTPLCHTMVISPPGCGKTTLLRDIVRQVSDGVPGLCSGMTVGVVDERSEIAGCYHGVPQNDVGCRTDVLDGCPKAEGMRLLLRAMAPDVIAVDELGGERDARAVEDVLNAGVKLLCTVHGHDLAEVRRNPALSGLLGHSLPRHSVPGHSSLRNSILGNTVFERFVVLSAPESTPGVVAGVYDGEGQYVVGA